MKKKITMERRVQELSARLPELHESDIIWIRKDFRKNGYRHAYHIVLDRCAEWQVIRYFYTSFKRSQLEVCQIWIDSDGDEVVLRRPRFMRFEGWVTDSELKFHRVSKYEAYSYFGDIRDSIPYCGVRCRSVLPALRRNGFKQSLHRLFSPYHLFHALLTMPRIETLWKAGQHHLVAQYYRSNIKDYLWQAIRVALRHGYQFTKEQQIKDWADMIRAMHHIGADTHNPKLVCPSDLTAAHDYWVAAYHREMDKEREQEQLRKALAYEPTYHADRERFLGLSFVDGNITIEVIPTAADIILEGKEMHHCVGGYYDKPLSLILSARVDGQRAETIEVSLEDYHIVQCRGLCNKSTPYHDAIMALMQRSLPEIEMADRQRKSA